MKEPVLPPPREFARSLSLERNELKKKMLLLGYISSRLAKRKAKIFLVGGQAVETYTGGVFATGDVDITTTDKARTEGLLERLGFSKEGMIWVSAKLGIAVHIVSSYPRRSLRARTIEVDRYSVIVVGIEDLILDRLAAAKHWKSQRDYEQARALLDAFADSIDRAYLKETAREDVVEDVLKKAMSRKPYVARQG